MGAAQSNTWFVVFARRAAHSAGRPAAFLAAGGLVVLWAATGPLFGFSDTWQLVINTSTTMVTFLMVFLIQNTQNRDTEAMQVKLDELIRVTRGAHNALLDLENLDETAFERVRENYRQLASEARQSLDHGRGDTDSPAVKAPARRRVKRSKSHEGESPAKERAAR